MFIFIIAIWFIVSVWWTWVYEEPHRNIVLECILLPPAWFLVVCIEFAIETLSLFFINK